MKNFLLSIILLVGFTQVQAQSCTTTFTPNPPVAGSTVTANATCIGLALPATLQMQIGTGAITSVACSSVFGSVVCSQTISIPSGTPVGTPIYAAVEKAGAFYGFASTASLAIALTNFTSTVEGNNAVLAWSVATDEAISAYSIEKQLNNSWVGVSIIEANNLQVYTTTLENLQTGINTLRLVSKSVNGDKVLKTFDVYVEMPNAIALSNVYPNPFSAKGTIDVTAAQTQPIEIKVFDMVGRVVSVVHQGILDANMPYQFSIDAKNLSAGTYLINVKGNQFVQTRLFTIVK